MLVVVLLCGDGGSDGFVGGVIIVVIETAKSFVVIIKEAPGYMVKIFA